MNRVKLLHLSDLHLGKSVMEVSMLPEQRRSWPAGDYAVQEA